MRLKEVQISDYKCIRKQCSLDITDITCLVGKNESGKTTILEALYRLNSIIPEHGSFNVDNDFPRIDVEDYRYEVEKGLRKPAIVTRATFSLEQADLTEIEKDFPGILAQSELILSKGYTNELYAELTVNEELAVESLLRKAELSSRQMKLFSRCTTIDELVAAAQNNTSEEGLEKLLPLISEIKDKGFLTYLYEKYIEDKVPKFLYFDEFYQMKGHVNIQGLIQRQQNKELLDSDYTLLGIIDLARLDLDEISNPKRALERDNRLEGASNHLTKSIMPYWSQNRYLEMRFDIRPALPDDPEGMQSGTNLWGHVYNSKQKVSTLLGRRSRGFVWFFSFIAWFSQQKRKNIPLIVLLDEPSLFLHGTAQSDLLRYLEDESQTGHQVIYTTQSPYMIDPNRLDRVRIVEDKSVETEELSSAVREGTQVYVDVLQTTKESIMPLQGALGYTLYNTLLTDPYTLVVESATELLYIQTLSALLEDDRREGLDRSWSITPLGGSKHIPALVSLMEYKQKSKIATLLVTAAENFFINKLFQKEHVFTYADFTNSTEADIEDLFDIDFYLSLVNAVYGEHMRKPITKGHLRGSSSRINLLIAQYLESKPLTDTIEFNRFKPARYFVENSSALKENISEETFITFENMFKRLNALL